MNERIANHLKLLLPFAAIGILSDFLVSGILKLIWIAIYAPTHLALAMTIGSYFLKTRLRQKSFFISLSYLVGVGGGHLYFEQHQSELRAQMKVITEPGETPDGFAASEFSEMLFVSDPSLAELMRSHGRDSAVEMIATTVTNYGCLDSLRVRSIAGIDVEQNADSRWTWRLTKVGVRQTEDPPPLFTHPLPWCQFHLDQLKGL